VRLEKKTIVIEAVAARDQTVEVDVGVFEARVERVEAILL
jgi:hypothetical protein